MSITYTLYEADNEIIKTNNKDEFLKDIKGILKKEFKDYVINFFNEIDDNEKSELIDDYNDLMESDSVIDVLTELRSYYEGYNFSIEG